MKRPITLTVVAVLLFLEGMAGVVSESVRTSSIAIIPNIHVFNTIAGVGLLKLWRGAYWYSSILLGWSSLVMLPMTLRSLLQPERMVIYFPLPSILIPVRPDAVMSMTLIWLITMGCTVLTGWMFWVLLQRNVRELFQPRPVVTV